ncbi:MAG: hypothetical protein U0165_07540 [Polyangiaceae bacterium]
MRQRASNEGHETGHDENQVRARDSEQMGQPAPSKGFVVLFVEIGFSDDESTGERGRFGRIRRVDAIAYIGTGRSIHAAGCWAGCFISATTTEPVTTTALREPQQQVEGR